MGYEGLYGQIYRICEQRQAYLFQCSCRYLEGGDKGSKYIGVHDWCNAAVHELVQRDELVRCRRGSAGLLVVAHDHLRHEAPVSVRDVRKEWVERTGTCTSRLLIPAGEFGGITARSSHQPPREVMEVSSVA